MREKLWIFMITECFAKIAVSKGASSDTDIESSSDELFQ